MLIVRGALLVWHVHTSWDLLKEDRHTIVLPHMRILAHTRMGRPICVLIWDVHTRMGQHFVPYS